MSFLNTSSLWFLMALPAVVLLYLLKVKREEKRISSTLLWEQVINDLAANTPFQRLRKNILMLLQLLLLAAIVFSLIRPVVKGESRPGPSTVIIIDNSGSMNAVEDGVTRFETAKLEAGKLIGSSSSRGGNEYMVLVAGIEVRTLSLFTDDSSLLKKRIAELGPTDLTANISDAILVAASAIKGRNDSSIYLITDGCGKVELPNIPELSNKLNIIQVGSPQRNLAIANLAAESLGRDNAHEVFVSVKNYSDEETKTLLSVYDGDDLVDVREIALGPFETKARSFIMLPSSRVIRCTIDSADALKSDNEAYCLIEEDRETTVLLITPGSVFLEKALASTGHTEVRKVAPLDYSVEMTDDADVIVFDKWVPDEIPAKRCAFIAPVSDVGPISFDGPLESLIVTDYIKDDPMLRFVSLRDLYISKMNKVSNTRSISPIASSRGIPVMGNFAVDNIEHFIVCFDLNNSEWAVRPSFPMFISNLIESIAAVNRTISATNILVGNTIEINRKGIEQRVFTTGPEGYATELKGKDNVLRFFDTSTSGLYTFTIGGEEKQVAVNFFNQNESDVFHRRDLAQESPQGTVSSSIKSVNKEIWKYFVIGALFVSMVEWMCFHKKIQ